MRVFIDRLYRSACCRYARSYASTASQIARAIIHAVAVNGFYETSSEVVAQVSRAALQAAADEGAHVVAMSALATGYGRLTMAQFARGVKEVMSEDIPEIREVVVVVRSADEAIDLSQALAARA